MVNRVFLVGFMGSGKTTIGKHLARDLSWQFVDMDEYFERKHQITITEFFAQHGEDAFRKAESEVVGELASQENIVVATGGGAPCFFDNLATMKRSGATIYINVEPEILAKRLRYAKSNRPLIAEKNNNELLQYINDKLAERQPFYRGAHIVVDGEALPFSTYRTLVEMFPEDVLNDED